MSLPVSRTLFLGPGYLCLPSLPTRLCTIVASGVAVTMYDTRQCLGGIGHFCHPKRHGDDSSPFYAAPALAGLVEMFKQAGSDPRHLETYLYGGAENPEAPNFDPGRGFLNSHTGFEILSKMGVRISGSDIGGRFARKLVFYTGTGECMLAKVTDIDRTDWYPSPMRHAAWTG